MEVFRLALARLTPLVHAAFASVFLRDPGDPTLLKLACAQNWPQSSARFLGQLRIRVGRGPTGEAVARRTPVEVEDVFAEPALREWWDPARELGFVSLISLPLGTPEHASGALTFYFDAPRRFGDDERHLLRLAADQLALATRRAARVEELRAENERMRAELAALQRSVTAATDTHRLREEFLANISHELRTPLTSILGYADLLRGGEAGTLEPRQRTLVDRVDAAATVLLHLINDLLQLTQLKLGRTPVVPEPCDAVLLARHAAELAGAPAPPVEFSIEPEAERMPITADAEKITKVLENLISNAFKFTKSGSVRVAVSEARVAGRPAIAWTVRDTGIGIRPELHESVFDEFRQVDGSSTRLYGGTGLGLALCRQLAAALGGSIEVQSRPGKGSTFTFTLPLPASP
ncbi:MAG TPA: GAF domain-containing sensor histidine kinase [Longimicrobiales bacterium]|nr:GAF domain-containing sensor histidine kinase [Longimicrobiales bacterium]